MAQQLNDIIAELDASYNPARKTINDRINGLQGAQDADIAGLQAQQSQAFDDITAGARARGIGFSGIPLGEQAKYTATNFLPAVAHVKQSYQDTRGSLLDALNNLGLDEMKTAQSIRQTQQAQDFQAQQAEAARRAEAASQASLSSLLGGGGSPSAQAAQTRPRTDPVQQIAYNDVASRINAVNAGHHTDGWLKSDYNATLASARRGNAKDKVKLELYAQLRPDLFGKSISASVLANGNQLRF